MLLAQTLCAHMPEECPPCQQLAAKVGGAAAPVHLRVPPCCCLQVVSWWGPVWREGTTDTQGVNTDEVLQEVVAVVERYPAMKVALHMEPYPGGQGASSIPTGACLASSSNNISITSGRGSGGGESSFTRTSLAQQQGQRLQQRQQHLKHQFHACSAAEAPAMSAAQQHRGCVPWQRPPKAAG